jgi:hypothetical protein
MDLVIVYTTTFGSVDTVLEYLKNRGYSPVALEKPTTDKPDAANDPSCNLIRDFVSPLVYIAVPREQEVAVRKILHELDGSRSRRIAIICETLRFQLLVATLATVIVAIVLLIDNPFDLYFPILYAVWLGTFIFIANLGRINAILNRQRIFRMRRRPPHG